MAGGGDIQWPPNGLQAEATKLRGATLSAAVGDVDKIIDMMLAARDQVAQAQDPHQASVALAKLQNPIKQAFEGVNSDLKEVTKLQRGFGRTLDKNLPIRPLPTETDAMADYSGLIDRALLMHFLREGDSAVAAMFMQEAQPSCKIRRKRPRPRSRPQKPAQDEAETADETADGIGLTAANGRGMADDDDDDDDDDDGLNGHDAGVRTPLPFGFDIVSDPDDNDDAAAADDGDDEGDDSEANPSDPTDSPLLLEKKFTEMYELLEKVQARDLAPAIDWAQANSQELETLGSSLEFDLIKLQYLWLCQGPAINGLPHDTHNGVLGARRYGLEHFARFKAQHSREIQQLCGALSYHPNLGASPYARLFDVGAAFSQAALALTRAFCSLLGLAPQSPLQTATVAGAIALPRLIKYMAYSRDKRTEWTSSDELAFETPLPASLIYHPIFVCPVLKVQSTERNPPMVLPCGHVICHDAVKGLQKHPRFKCPYCPTEGLPRDAIAVRF